MGKVQHIYGENSFLPASARLSVRRCKPPCFMPYCAVSSRFSCKRYGNFLLTRHETWGWVQPCRRRQHVRRRPSKSDPSTIRLKVMGLTYHIPYYTVVYLCTAVFGVRYDDVKPLFVPYSSVPHLALRRGISVPRRSSTVRQLPYGGAYGTECVVRAWPASFNICFSESVLHL